MGRSNVYNSVIGVPCHGELIRYVRWHDNAFILLRTMKLPSMTIHYDDFHSDFGTTLKQLLNFLQQKAVIKPAPFFHSVHDDFYKDDIVKMSEFIRLIASKETLQCLKRYLVKDSITGQEIVISKHDNQL